MQITGMKSTNFQVAIKINSMQAGMLGFRVASAKPSAYGPLRKLRVQESSACLVEPMRALISPSASQTKMAPDWVPFYVWWSRRESNPRPQALHRQFYILSLVV